jgi:hypothetical protein
MADKRKAGGAGKGERGKFDKKTGVAGATSGTGGSGFPLLYIAKDNTTNLFVWNDAALNLFFKKRLEFGDIFAHGRHHVFEHEDGQLVEIKKFDAEILKREETLRVIVKERDRLEDRIGDLTDKKKTTGSENRELDEMKTVLTDISASVLVQRTELGALRVDKTKLEHDVKVARENIEKRIRDYNAQKTAVFSEIQEIISKNSLEDMKNLPEWDAVYASRDPLELYKLARKHHQRGQLSSDIDVIVDRTDKLYRMTMGGAEALNTYHTRFLSTMEALKAVAEAGRIPSMKEQVAIYIRGLDKARFAHIHVQYANDTYRDSDKVPKTLQDAKDFAGRYMAAKLTHSTMHTAYGANATMGGNNAGGRNQGAKPKAGGATDKKQETAPTPPSNAPRTPPTEKHVKFEGPCWNCKKIGHKRQDCKSPKVYAANAELTTEVDYDEVYDEVYDEDGIIIGGGYMMNASIIPEVVGEEPTVICGNNFALDAHKAENCWRVLLDCGSNINVVSNIMLLTNVRRSDVTAVINGIGGKLCSNVIGDFYPYGIAWLCPDAGANLLSWNYAHAHGNRFEFCHEKNEHTLTTNGVAQKFTPTGTGHYGYDHEPRECVVSEANHTLADVLTKAEIKNAQAALKVWQRVGPVGPNKMKYLLRGERKTSPQALDTGINLYGPPAELKIARSTLPGPVLDREGRILDYGHKVLTMYCDLMTIFDHMFFVTRLKPIGLGITTHLGPSRRDKKSVQLHDAVEVQLNLCKSHGFSVQRIIIDGEKGFLAVTPAMQAQGIKVTINTSTHVPEAEVLIRELEAWCRGTYNSLPYKLPLLWIPDLVACASQRLNLLITDAGLSGVPPIEAFTGVPVNLEYDCPYQFGTHVLATVKETKTRNAIDEPRVESAIVVGVHNRNGLHRVRLLASGALATRVKVTPFPTTDAILQRIKEFHKVLVTDVVEEPAVAIEEANARDNVQVGEPTATAAVAVVDPDEPSSDDDESSDTSEEGADGITVSADANTDGGPTVQGLDSGVLRHDGRENRRPRIDYATLNSKGHAIVKGRAYLANIDVLRRRHGDEAVSNAIYQEVSEIVQRDVFEPINASAMSEEDRKGTLRSFLLLSEKTDPKGQFERVKARLVANGAEQLTWEETSSPTASVSTLFMVCSVAASRGYQIATSDIRNAYLNAKLPSKMNIILKLDKRVSDVIVTHWPKFQSSVRDGAMYVRLRGALYGCKESALLWYAHIAKTLTEYGLTRSKADWCLFYSHELGLYVVLYVDDVLAACSNKQRLEAFLNMLETKYGKMKKKLGAEHAYLGMILRFEHNQFIVDMTGYIKEVLDSCSALQFNTRNQYPADAELFRVSTGCEELSAVERKQFHSIVAKLLYVAKRGRPDILLTVSFLATRVTKAAKDDWKKLMQLLHYLSISRSVVVKIGVGAEPELRCFVDASFASHADKYGHTGVVLSLGVGGLYFQSRKQKAMCKSSFEAELCAVSDAVAAIIWHREVLHELGVPVRVRLLQDNRAVVDVLSSGTISGESSRHVLIRYGWVLAYVKEMGVSVEWIDTKAMWADILTKPVLGDIWSRLFPLLVGSKSVLF